MSADEKPNVRLSRESTTREKETRVWKPASTMPEIVKEPGYSYRWVRVSTLGQPDPRNYSAKTREGYEAVSIEEQPHLKYTVDSSSRFKDNVEVEGLLLMKIPTDMLLQRKRHYANLNKQQLESVDNTFMKENDPRMPLFRERRSATSFGKGK